MKLEEERRHRQRLEKERRRKKRKEKKGAPRRHGSLHTESEEDIAPAQRVDIVTEEMPEVRLPLPRVAQRACPLPLWAHGWGCGRLGYDWTSSLRFHCVPRPGGAGPAPPPCLL